MDIQKRYLYFVIKGWWQSVWFHSKLCWYNCLYLDCSFMHCFWYNHRKIYVSVVMVRYSKRYSLTVRSRLSIGDCQRECLTVYISRPQPLLKKPQQLYPSDEICDLPLHQICPQLRLNQKGNLVQKRGQI